MTQSQQAGSPRNVPCSFCQIIQRKAPARRVLNTTGVVAFFPLRPAALGHILVVPKRHVERVWDLDAETTHLLAGASVRIARAVHTALSPDGLNLIQSNGDAATQTVEHLHVHVVPRWYGDLVGDFWPDESPWTDKQLDGARSEISAQL
ncbi:MAG: HIT family protein [Angustibacter sp.]